MPVRGVMDVIRACCKAMGFEIIGLEARIAKVTLSASDSTPLACYRAGASAAKAACERVTWLQT